MYFGQYNILLMDFFFIQAHIFSLHKIVIDAREWCDLLVDYFSGVFISCLDTHSLQRIHWWASDATYLQMKKQTIELTITLHSMLSQLILS